MHEYVFVRYLCVHESVGVRACQCQEFVSDRKERHMKSDMMMCLCVYVRPSCVPLSRDHRHGNDFVGLVRLGFRLLEIIDGERTLRRLWRRARVGRLWRLWRRFGVLFDVGGLFGIPPERFAFRYLVSEFRNHYKSF